ncbi:helix-turn-helix domain-containing protein [Parasutterella excrementihominis]|uniref:helix-turn-helix domain-containing protein n=1 Tax=Parasutterella excrementihominis TaxID=487175 RepID=UPI00242B2434|nr:helix-turn-helix domain-containing protein [Parasutterella excrementihominis]
MSWQDSDTVRKLFVGNSAAKSVLRCLADHRNEQTGQCNPSADAIAWETELNKKTVYKAITYLEEKGFIRRERRVLNSSNNYVLNLSDPRNAENGTSTKNGSTKNGISDDPKTGRVDDPNLGHESVIETVKETVNTICVDRAESAPTDTQKNAPVENNEFTLTEPVEKELTPEQKALKVSKHCPQQKLIDLYHECLPGLPPVRIWTSASRVNNLAARWREMALDQGFQSEADGLDFFKRFFEFVGRSKFLMGQVKQKDGRTFRADLEWITKANNFEKICDRKYHDR